VVLIIFKTLSNPLYSIKENSSEFVKMLTPKIIPIMIIILIIIMKRVCGSLRQIIGQRFPENSLISCRRIILSSIYVLVL